MTLSRAPSSGLRTSETQTGISNRQLLRHPPALREETRRRPIADSGGNSKRRSSMSATEVRSFTIPVQPAPVAAPSGDTLLWTAAQRDGERSEERRVGKA